MSGGTMWLSDLQIVLPDGILERGSICIEAGQFVDIVEGPVPGAAVQGAGLMAIPGLIDMHGDMLERDISPRPGAELPFALALYELDKRLVATGITTAYAAISFAWHTGQSLRSDSKARAIMATINALRPTLLADHYVHARFEITNPQAGAVLEEMILAGQVHLASIMDHTPGQGQYRDIEGYVKQMFEWRRKMGDPLGGNGKEITETDVRESVVVAQQRPKAWDAVYSVAQVARKHGVVLASHDDDTVEKVNLMLDVGINLSEFPVTKEAAYRARQQGIHVAMGAPNALQGRSLSGNLSAADAIADGLVDILATDYYPASMLQAAFALAERGVLPLYRAIKLVSEHVADGLRLHDRGQIAVGKVADLVLLDCQGSLPRVHGTLRHGHPVYWDKFMHVRGTLRATSPAISQPVEVSNG
ncbi:MAG: alpha-D-ribose 1-methylphosphonate 5-triphosphate diphosphatase [Caldilineaceae bacterium]|nr:alpha-D-ribose 1-methylphosphonate 5-triphosphate diphosphatase [Caldilineaceae bacterium]